MTDVLKTIKNLMKESTVSPEDIALFKDPDSKIEDKIMKYGEMIRKSGHHKSFQKIIRIGYLKLMAYFGDDLEARRFEEWAKKQFSNTKIIVTYKSISTGNGKAGVILDSRNLESF